MRNPESALPGLMDGATRSLSAELASGSDSSAWAAKWDLDVHEILERATELTLVDWLELADLLSGHF